MEINRVLAKTKLEQFREELSALDREIHKHPTQAKEIESLKIFVRLKLQETEMLMVAMDHLEGHAIKSKPNFEEMFRQVRQDARGAFIKWRRFRANQGRLEKKTIRLKKKQTVS